MAKLYKQFAEGWTGLDYSDEALVAMYNQESYGEPLNEHTNGYYIGKQWMGVTVSMWKEEQRDGNLSVLELYQDPRLPWWWLDMIFVGYRDQMIEDGFDFLKGEQQ